MTTYFSFLNTLKAFVAGSISPTESDHFTFNCRRSRVFPPDGAIPGYVSEMNSLQIPRANTTLLKPEDLHPDTLQLWLALKPILELADAQGRVAWTKDESGTVLSVPKGWDFF